MRLFHMSMCFVCVFQMNFTSFFLSKNVQLQLIGSSWIKIRDPYHFAQKKSDNENFKGNDEEESTIFYGFLNKWKNNVAL